MHIKLLYMHINLMYSGESKGHSMILTQNTHVYVTHPHIHTYIHTYIHTRHKYIHTYSFIPLHTYIHTYKLYTTEKQMPLHDFDTHTHTHTHTFTSHTHTHTHTHTYKLYTHGKAQAIP